MFVIFCVYRFANRTHTHLVNWISSATWILWLVWPSAGGYLNVLGKERTEERRKGDCQLWRRQTLFHFRVENELARFFCWWKFCLRKGVPPFLRAVHGLARVVAFEWFTKTRSSTWLFALLVACNRKFFAYSFVSERLAFCLQSWFSSLCPFCPQANTRTHSLTKRQTSNRQADFFCENNCEKNLDSKARPMVVEGIQAWRVQVGKIKCIIAKTALSSVHTPLCASKAHAGRCMSNKLIRFVSSLSSLLNCFCSHIVHGNDINHKPRVALLNFKMVSSNNRSIDRFGHH